MKKTYGFRLDKGLYKFLCEYSKNEERSTAYFVEKALRKFLNYPTVPLKEFINKSAETLTKNRKETVHADTAKALVKLAKGVPEKKIKRKGLAAEFARLSEIGL